MRLTRRIRVLEHATFGEDERCGTCGYKPGEPSEFCVLPPGETHKGPDTCPECGFLHVLRLRAEPLPRAGQ